MLVKGPTTWAVVAALPAGERRSDSVIDLELQLERRELELESTLRAIRGVRDPLTGLAGHRRFDESARREWRLAVRHATPLTLMRIGIDDLALYNERAGWDAGDAQLIRVAEVLRELLRRPGDFLARYLGAEFTALLPNTSQDGALQVAERFHAAVDALAIPHDASPTGRLRVSIGVSSTRPMVDSVWQEFELETSARQALASARDEQIPIVCRSPEDE